MTNKEKEKEVSRLMTFGYSRVEAEDIYDCDRRIEEGEKLFELTDEQKKASKDATIQHRQPTVYKFQKRERKPNEEKREIIADLIKAVEATIGEVAEITNPEREFTFIATDGKKYKITLSCPRS